MSEIVLPLHFQQWVRQQQANKPITIKDQQQLIELVQQLGNQKEISSKNIENAHFLVFAGDHGWVNEPVPTTSYRLIQDIIANGEILANTCQQQNLTLLLCDVGVRGTFAENTPEFVKFKIRPGTEDIRQQNAMTLDECEAALDAGRTLVNGVQYRGCNTVGFGVLGTGGEVAAGLLLHTLLGWPIDDCFPAGSPALDINPVIARTQGAASPLEVLSAVGGLELAAVVGGMLQAAENGMHILAAGPSVSAALAVACFMEPQVAQFIGR